MLHFNPRSTLHCKCFGKGYQIFYIVNIFSIFGLIWPYFHFSLLVSWTIAVVLSVLGFLTILAVILCICYCLKNKNKKKQHAFGIKKNYFKVFPKYILSHRSNSSLLSNITYITFWWSHFSGCLLWILLQ